MLIHGRVAGSGRNGLPERRNYVYRGSGSDEHPETARLPDPPVRARPPYWREQANARERAKRAADPEYRAREAARHRAWRERQAVN